MDEDSQEITVHVSANERFLVNRDKVRRLALQICRSFGVASYELHIEIVCAEEIKALNHSYRGINNVTDVLSFPQEKWPRPLVFQREPKTLPKDSGPPKTLGDVVICLEKAESNAAEIGQDLDREFCFLLVHGFLHLCGHDHQNETEEALMTEQQQLIMSLFANSESGAIWKHCVSIQGSET